MGATPARFATSRIVGIAHFFNRHSLYRQDCHRTRRDLHCAYDMDTITISYSSVAVNNSTVLVAVIAVNVRLALYHHRAITPNRARASEAELDKEAFWWYGSTSMDGTGIIYGPESGGSSSGAGTLPTASSAAPVWSVARSTSRSPISSKRQRRCCRAQGRLRKTQLDRSVHKENRQ